jgi:hypothetical protein
LLGGLDVLVMGRGLNVVARQVAAGHRLSTNEEIHGILENNYSIIVKAVDDYADE